MAGTLPSCWPAPVMLSPNDLPVVTSTSAGPRRAKTASFTCRPTQTHPPTQHRTNASESSWTVRRAGRSA